MRRFYIFLLYIFIFVESGLIFGQGSWSVGLGFSNFVMQGDLRSYRNIKDVKNNLNPGGYLYINKMVNPAFGFEAKFDYQKMSGGAFELSDSYMISDTNFSLGNTRFEGTAYGGELLALININGLHPDYLKNKKWAWGLFAGIGLHYYDSKLYDIDTGKLLIDYGNSPSKDSNTESFYYTAGINLKYFISNNFSIEVRQEFSLNEEDHLDAARSSKEPLDFFYKTGIGLVFHLNRKDVKPMIWGGNKNDDEEDFQKDNLLFVDSDGDGVIDKFDKDPNTPAGVPVYGNGTPVDTDYDGVPDYKDKCPLVKAATANGCPEAGSNAESQTTASNNDTVLQTDVYSVFFDVDSDFVKPEFYNIIRKVYLLYKNNNNINIKLNGYADTTGNENHNLNLSKERVQSVKKALVNIGINSENITTKAFGSSVTTFDEPRYRSYNRRVDIFIVK